MKSVEPASPTSTFKFPVRGKKRRRKREQDVPLKPWPYDDTSDEGDVNVDGSDNEQHGQAHAQGPQEQKKQTLNVQTRRRGAIKSTKASDLTKLLASQQQHSRAGDKAYLDVCKSFHCAPSSRFVRKIQCTRVDLSFQNLRPGNAIALGVALKENDCIQQLNLRGNNLGVAEVQAIAAGLAENTCITDLNLSKNAMGSDAGMLIVDELLTLNNSITCLNISENCLDCDVAAVLAQCMADKAGQSKGQLRHLDLSQNLIRSKGAYRLQCYFEEKESKLEYLNLSYNDLRADGGYSVLKGLSMQVREYAL
jgi:hypothetical protein